MLDLLDLLFEETIFWLKAINEWYEILYSDNKNLCLWESGCTVVMAWTCGGEIFEGLEIRVTIWSIKST